MNCENCGIPEGSYSHLGYWLKLAFLTDQDEYGRKRHTRKTIWTCGSECAVQTIAIAAMGLPTHKWPMSLREFTARLNAAGKLGFLKGGLTRDKYPPETRINREVHEGLELNLEELYAGQLQGEFVTPKNVGRPQVKNPNSATRRKRRQRALIHDFLT